MIYDTFLYNGEIDMLRLRVEALKDVVDLFIPIEGMDTFTGEAKMNGVLPVAPWTRKVRVCHVFLPVFSNPWVAEQWSRNMVIGSLVALKPEDTVLVGDVDEIPDPLNVRKHGVHVMENYLYNFSLKKMDMIGTVSIPGAAILDGVTPANIRSERKDYPQLKGGAHLCNFFMGPEEISKKIKSFSHTEFNKPEFTDPEKIKSRMIWGIDLFDRQDPEEVVSHCSTVPRFLERPLASFLASR